MATNAISACAFGVVTGALLVTLAATKLNRCTLLRALMALFICGNLLSALAVNLEMFALARFIPPKYLRSRHDRYRQLFEDDLNADEARSLGNGEGLTICHGSA
ncbi:hypothetical protein [Rhizobium sp. 18055]|uniref:hypothetical protein n=1 Tax=Rhizobium sp. 18055 TaxID=2681403 RepID=UPI0013576941|nr:hypothetical protein [Rhizobium sp. 18055]